jgi:endonuclease/exonuclease/phosphatase family metal-dependent hydrolase
MKRQREDIAKFGKWMLFVDNVDEIWVKVQTLNVYASRFNSVIFVYSQTSDKTEILQLGTDIALKLEYISPTGFLCYKSIDKVGCARMGLRGDTNYTYRIPVPLTKQLNIPEFDEEAMRSVSGYYEFEIPYQVKEHAKELGAQYDKNTKKWYAETKEIWGKLAQFWKPIYNSDFSIFSLNIWKSPIDVESRITFITREIKSLMPTIVLFQEVTLQSFEVLNPIMKQLGYIGHQNPQTDFFLVSYYLPSKCKLEKFEMARAPSNNDTRGTTLSEMARAPARMRPLCNNTLEESLKQNRSMHLLSLAIKQEKFTIANIHLAASEANSNLRLSQLQYLFTRLSNVKFVISGDTNLQEDIDYMDDVWKVTGSSIGTMGTWNPRENTNLSHISKNVGMCRFDRMFTKEIFAQSLQLCLRKPMENLQHASDHFAIFARFRL